MLGTRIVISSYIYKIDYFTIITYNKKINFII